MSKIGILGSGGWGIALGMVLEANGHDVIIWSKFQSEIDDLINNREHKKSLPGVKIPEKIEFTTNIGDTVKDKDLIICAVPSSFLRSTIREASEFIDIKIPIVVVSKGIEEGTGKVQTEIIEDEVKDCTVCALSGPTHAEEVSRKMPTTIVAASKDEEVAKFVQTLLMADYFRVYTSDDVMGVELGGSLKNVIALAAGMADGMGCGDNAKAALITRGIYEITKLGLAMGGNIETFFGLSGIGDLIVTCASVHSRNRRAGVLMGQGKTMDEAVKEVQMVVEGIYSAKSALELAKKYNVSMPIIEEVNKILFENKPVKDALNDLMTRDKKAEHITVSEDKIRLG